MKRIFLAFLIALGATRALCGGDATQLTTGPGNDTEVAWSPDGKQVVFQTDRNGDLDLYVLDLATKKLRPLVTGPGHACFPAWSPDGEWIAYAYAHFTKTAREKNEHGYNIFAIPSKGGEPRRLTSGLFRDYSPVFSVDGRTIYFSSARFPKINGVGIFSIPFAGGEPKPVVSLGRKDEAAVQPDFSADGKFLAYGYIHGFRGNWSVRIAKTKRPADSLPLSDGRTVFYGPRWSPKEKLIASTGYVVGDPGWNIWLISLEPLQRVRITKGPGNSRSPSWSPDGRELIFENNRTGTYKLYRMPVPKLPDAPKPVADENARTVLRFDFSKNPGDVPQDLSDCRNVATTHGAASWRDGAMCFDGKDAWIAMEKPKGFDFGAGIFCVKATVSVPSHTGEVRIICVGDYPDSHNGWQLYLGPSNRAYFNSRNSEKLYIGAVSDDEIPIGRPVTLLGMRLKSGEVKLFVDGALQRRPRSGAIMSYPEPNQVRIGAQWNGKSLFGGQIYELAVYTRELTEGEIEGDSLRRFLRD